MASKQRKIEYNFEKECVLPYNQDGEKRIDKTVGMIVK